MKHVLAAPRPRDGPAVVRGMAPVDMRLFHGQVIVSAFDGDHTWTGRIRSIEPRIMDIGWVTHPANMGAIRIEMPADQGCLLFFLGFGPAH